MGHHIKGKDFVSDKYRILKIDDLEKLQKLNKSAKPADHIEEVDERAYNQALEDIEKLSEEVSLNKIVLSFKDKLARIMLIDYAYRTPDRELGEDILEVFDNYKE